MTKQERHDRAIEEGFGSMEALLPLMPEHLGRFTNPITYEELCAQLDKYGLSIQNVVHDPCRVVLHTFYSDFDHGLYCQMFLDRDNFCSVSMSELYHLSHHLDGNLCLQERDWLNYYRFHVPVPLQAYDFKRRLRQIETERVFEVWHQIYTKLGYANGTWSDDIIQYVFAHAPELAEQPELNEHGLVTLYRGAGGLSQPPEKALSWSTNPISALWFANHSGKGTHFITAEVELADIVAYYPSYWTENEVIVWPGKIVNAVPMDVLPSTQDTVNRYVAPVLPQFIKLVGQVARLGYPMERNSFEVHGQRHIMRVLLLSLIYAVGEHLDEKDKNVLAYFSLLHDIGRTNEYADPEHGAASVRKIHAEGIRLSGVPLDRRDYLLAETIIQYHSRDDADGMAAINALPGLNRKERARAVRLFHICKDMDGLDRVRFNGLDYRLLRTEYARRLILIAGCILKETDDLVRMVQEKGEAKPM